MHVHIIANPVSGGGRGARRAEALGRALDALGLSCDVEETHAAGDARDAAARTGADCVAVVGGDGTVNEALNGLAGREAMLAVFPSGTANVVARELGMPRDPGAAARCIAAGRTRALDVGVCAARRFLLGVGAGFDAAVVHEMTRRRGRRSSVLHWVVPAAHTILRYPYPPIRVTADGAVVSETTQYAIVGNCRYSAGVFPATPHARPDDGLLDVCLFHGVNALKLLALGLAVWRPAFTRRRDVVYRQAREVVLEPADGGEVPLHVDGDPAGHLPGRFAILPGAVRVVVPTAEEP